MSDDREKKPPGGVSRRSFLRGSAAAGLAGGLLPSLACAAEAAPQVVAGVPLQGPEAVPVALRVNGKPLQATLEPRVTLLDALRETWGLTGAKKVCDRGTCGACTVLLDGQAVYACSVLALEAQGAEIATVEGLAASDDALDPLQAAFVANDAQQCGFCTPGFVMAAKGLLAENPRPELADVHRGLAGNFCRCGTYAGMRRAVLEAAGKEESRA